MDHQLVAGRLELWRNADRDRRADEQDRQAQCLLPQNHESRRNGRLGQIGRIDPFELAQDQQGEQKQQTQAGDPVLKLQFPSLDREARSPSSRKESRNIHTTATEEPDPS
jgi:hypothetical protein